MERAAKSPTNQTHAESPAAERATLKTSGEADAIGRSGAAVVRSPAAWIQSSPRMAAQRKQLEGIQNGARIAAQGKSIANVFGESAQFKGEAEQEEPLQGRFQIAQPQGTEEEELLQGKFDPVQHQSGPGGEELLQGKFAPAERVEAEPDREFRENNTGLPDNLKAGIELLSDISLDLVKVHYNSARPAQLNAVAYAQGSDIHVAPGQEQHLPHEAWHVVQQAQGRVKPMMKMKDGVPVNDDAGLEHEAAVMGTRADTGVEQFSWQNASPDHYSAAAPAESQRVVQRQITVDHIDYNPQTMEYRDGYIHQANFYQAVRVAMLASAQFGAVYTNHWNNVRNELASDFNAADIDAMTTAICQAIIARYGGERPLIAGARVGTLETIVRNALVTNIQPDHQVNMTEEEAAAYDQLATTAGATTSRAKGTPNTVQYANLPGPLKAEVTARLTEIRNERALWTATTVSLTPELTLPNGEFGRDVCARQAGMHYQGNHTNFAGWLPAVGAPANHVEQAALAIYNAATGGLQQRLTAGNAMALLGYTRLAGQPNANRYRNEYEVLRAAHVPAIGTPNVKMSAMSALCQGVSGYIEFSMGGGISRLMFDAANNRVYVTAHYKWREGKSPFFEVLGFPPV